jgi:hypothetical protein
MKHSRFSCFLARSARYGKTFEVGSAMQLALVTRADTSPELGHYELEASSYEFVFEGKTHRTTVPLSAVLKDGRRCSWDVAQERYSAKGVFALQVRQERARLEGAEYVLFKSDILGSSYAEVKNRKTAQAYLYQARDFDTDELETACLMELVHGSRTLQELSTRLGRPLVTTAVAALRLWMKSKVLLPLTTELLQPSWLVRRSDGHA